MRHRVAWIGWPLALAAAIAASAPAVSAASRGGAQVTPLSIRVLLLEGAPSVSIRPADSPTATTFQAHQGALQRPDGSLVPHLLFPAPGPHEIDGTVYRGALEIQAGESGLRVVNEVDLETYVAGTLLAEVYEGWGPVVLRAQAVATRTYALYRLERARDPFFHVRSGPVDQAYAGVRVESPAAWEAVRATHGEYLAWGGEPILAAYHAASGGRTASSHEVWGRPLPYLVSAPVEGEHESPDTYWRVPFTGDQIGDALARAGWPIGSVTELRVLDRSLSGRVRKVRARGRRSSATLTARQLRSALDADRLKSTLFEIRAERGGYVFVGSGRGHGVGMSQWGARAMADRGADYREILFRFYPGATVRHLVEVVPASLTGPSMGGAR